MTDQKTHFGYSQVHEHEKARKVAEVFDSVAGKYDIMNDLMSGGLHRVWKAATVARAAVRPGMRVLDIAGGTGDLSKAFLKKVGTGGEVWLTDINESMLRAGRNRLTDQGLLPELALCNAEALPFPTDYFDVVTVAFGLRNMTHKDHALAEMRRVIKPGGKVMVLEFSRVNSLLAPAYDVYSFKILPMLGRLVANDADSYNYLAESIRMHPDQQTLLRMMQDAGLEKVQYTNFTAGVVALHTGTKFE
ncbi:MAG: bifunctional demethylmenaquinone methyltransferase/2-methoxy-6-polyprenyl-1,4-benzoquinol methylase UbiE [Limnobacter sp.]|nr:bifunctional demethylmenaquinone methyltransferase/2-methoxy-6-polyprenyl-1,4-benzoquinol methylase UbiE [Limnobacter sp.]